MRKASAFRPLLGEWSRAFGIWTYGDLGVELAETVYRVTARFPKAELFGLTAQMRRAAVSIPSNIAEGRARDSTREFLHFLAISRGSLAELETQLELAIRLDYTRFGAARCPGPERSARKEAKSASYLDPLQAANDKT